MSDIDREIIAMREAGMSCRDVSDRLQIEEYEVWNCMRQHGLAGKFRAKPKPSARKKITIDTVLDEFFQLEIERGINGGYLVTAGGNTTEEMPTLKAALRAVLQ